MNDKVYYYFKEISKIPRETYNIDDISNYLVNFAKDRNLEVYQDDVKNVIIKKKASIGYEVYSPIILQAHMDMVCQKEDNSSHDFSRDGIEVIEENGVLRANGTTLGADDGIGVAMILSVLDTDLNSPKIEALFTVNEEVGMDGAIHIDMKQFDGKRLINLDSEEEGILIAGCAGGVRLEVSYKGEIEKKYGKVLNINISSLLGGHSGTDINKGRANAIKVMGKILDSLGDISIISINGGKVDNAICDSCDATVMIYNDIDLEKVKSEWKKYLDSKGEVNSKVDLNIFEKEELVFTKNSSNIIINYLNTIDDGVISYEDNLIDMVQTSINFGTISTNENIITFKHLIRSSVDSSKDKLVSKIMNNYSDMEVSLVNSYSGWSYNDKSNLRELMINLYKEMYNKELKVEVIHAGLECGMFVSKKNDLDAVSIGPNIRDAHTPNEMVEIDSVNRVYDYLIKVLEDLR